MLKDMSKKITENLFELRESLNHAFQTQKGLEEKYLLEYKEANAHGDSSENSALTEAIAGLHKSQRDMQDILSRLTALDTIDESQFHPCGIVVMYSTVRFVEEKTGKEYVFKLYPKGVSDLSKHILSVDSPIGAQLKQKSVGSTITRTHRVTGEILLFVIQEIY